MDKLIILDQSGYSYLHDAVFDTFDESLSNLQLDRLIALHPNFDGTMDTMGRDDIMDSICFYFVQMKVPSYNSGGQYEKEFCQKIKDNKGRFLEFIPTLT